MSAARKMDVHFSSASSEWATPPDFFAKILAEFGPFDLDPAADASNAKAPRFYTRADDGLTKAWFGRVWCNPPYGRNLGEWVRRGYESTHLPHYGIGADIVVMLLPARPDTAAWHDFIFPYAEVRFIRGRLKFGAAKSSAPFPSAVVVFDRRRSA